MLALCYFVYLLFAQPTKTKTVGPFYDMRISPLPCPSEKQSRQTGLLVVLVLPRETHGDSESGNFSKASERKELQDLTHPLHKTG